MTYRLTRRRAGRGCALLASAAAVVAAVAVSPAGAAPPDPRRSSVAGSDLPDLAGGFGMPRGGLQKSVRTGDDPAPSTGSAGGCAGYASSVGVNMYCLSGGVDVPTLRQRFGGLKYDPCRAYDVPAGMRAPRNTTPEIGRYFLQACIDGIDWDTVTGGDIKVTLSWTYGKFADGDPTKDDLNPLEEFLWQQALSRSYPIPFATAWPRHIPLVNVPTWFQFRWLSDGTEIAREGPYSDNQDGGPYLEMQANGVTLRAESTAVRVDPQVKGMDTVGCGAVPKPYNQEGRPAPEDQPSDCYITFEHSSAAAEELSEVPLPEPSDDYPIPMYVINIEVDWHVTMTSANGTTDLGTHTFVAYQQLPVTEAPSYVSSGG